MPDVGNHVMACYIRSKDLLEVQQAIENGVQRKLKMQPVQLINYRGNDFERLNNSLGEYA